MNHDKYDDAYIRAVLDSARTIAMVGASPNASRASHGVMGFLQAQGRRVIPINPGHAGASIRGETVVASLGDVAEPIDMVDVFRNSAAAGDIIREALAEKDRLGLKSIWLQLGVRDDAAAAEAEAAGVRVVMNRCPAIEIPRLGL